MKALVILTDALMTWVLAKTLKYFERRRAVRFSPKQPVYLVIDEAAEVPEAMWYNGRARQCRREDN